MPKPDITIPQSVRIEDNDITLTFTVLADARRFRVTTSDGRRANGFLEDFNSGVVRTYPLVGLDLGLEVDDEQFVEAVEELAAVQGLSEYFTVERALGLKEEGFTVQGAVRLLREKGPVL